MLNQSGLQRAALIAAALATASPAILADTASDQKAAKDAAKVAAAAAATLAEQKRHMNYWERLDADFREQLGAPCYEPPAPAAPAGKEDKAVPPPDGCQRRGLPAPFDSPPYPDGEWQLGGSPIIGDSGIVAPGPIMQAFYDGPNGDAWKASRFQIYGWEDFSGNLSTSHNDKTQSANFPESYDLRSNRLEENQFVLYLERTPDECQTDHFDWGFRISGVYGLDYRYMISRGFLSDQLIKDNHYYGFDMPMMYGNIYVPWVAEGMNICFGRFISLADIEAQLAPNNLMSSHSLLYTFDPYTQWGVASTIKMNKNWTVQLGLTDGNDVAPWQHDPGREATGTAMVQWVSDNNMDSIYGGANAFNNANFGYNNIQQYVATYSHKFSEKVWTSTEGWYMFQRNATTAPTADVPYQNGAFPVSPGFVHEWAFLNYTMWRIGPGLFFTVRNEVFDDAEGNRTGYATVYSEHSIGFTWWPDKLITIRPELRYEHSYAEQTYDNGTRKNQVTAQIDFVLHF